MEMHKRRKTLTEPEVRYMVKQIALACDYLHERNIIHRDLKLGNLFLNDNMELKVGDFGLATRVNNEGDRKLTLCGTPNYIAPEVLMKKGHSYEVDVWSLGCIVYTLIVGKPPFETDDLKNTYRKIRYNEYNIPSRINPEVRVFIQKMLQPNPKERPTMKQILADQYLTYYIPSRLPVSCLTMAPRLNNGRLSMMPDEFLSPRRPLTEKNQESKKVEEDVKTVATNGDAANANNGHNPLSGQPVTNGMAGAVAKPPSNNHHVVKPDEGLIRNNYYLTELFAQLRKLVAMRPEAINENADDAEDPAATPIFWISKWVDYTDKYGVGYQLCDNSVGVLYNDLTRIVLLADGHNLQYIERDGTESYHTFDKNPEHLYKKIVLVKYFRNYMNDHLLKLEKNGDRNEKKQEDVITRLPYLNNWFRTRNAIVFHLTNGTVQINFFHDHTKLILCPLMGAVTYINEQRDFRTFRFSLIEKHGCANEVATRLRYARDVVDRLLTHKLTGGNWNANKK